MSHDNPNRSRSGKRYLILLILILIALSALNFVALLDLKTALLQQTKLIHNDSTISHTVQAAAERAYMIGTGTQIQNSPTPDGNEQVQISPQWQNVGNTPADPVYFEVRCPIIVEKNQEIPKQQLNDTQAGQQLQAPDKPVSYIKATLAPRQASGGGACIFTKDQLILLLPSKPHLFLTARAVYHDVFPGSPLHVTEYCSETIPVKGADNKVNFQTGLCPKFNCTDDQCPEEERKDVEKQYEGK